MTLILELPEDIQRELHALAERTKQSDEAVALMVLREYLERNGNGGATQPEAEELSDADFETIARGVVRDYREVLERLA